MPNFTYSDVRNCKWVNQRKDYLVCEVNFDHLPEEYVEFACTAAEDIEFPHTKEIYDRALAGDFGPIAEVEIIDYNAGPEADKMSIMRDQRLSLLGVYDHIRDSSQWRLMTAEKQQEWDNFRQALLDLPSTVTVNDFTVAWDDNGLGYKIVEDVFPSIPD